MGNENKYLRDLKKKNASYLAKLCDQKKANDITEITL